MSSFSIEVHSLKLGDLCLVNHLKNYRMKVKILLQRFFMGKLNSSTTVITSKLDSNYVYFAAYYLFIKYYKNILFLIIFILYILIK